MIYCIWYPSGGFGHFISAILSLYGKNFARPSNKKIQFAEDGNAHSMELTAPKLTEPMVSSGIDKFEFDFDPTFNYSVLVDPGINNESFDFQKLFPTATPVKICYSDNTWPIVARTMIDKAMVSTLDKQLQVDKDKWLEPADWAKREKYFLFLRDHQLRNSWRSSNFPSIWIDDMLTYPGLHHAISNVGIEIKDFNADWHKWRQANCVYLDPVYKSLLAVDHIKNKVNRSLSDINDIWSQAVLYYFLWTEFHKEVPHNNYADFFADTDSVRQWLGL
jgi:hypothetical protein